MEKCYNSQAISLRWILLLFVLTRLMCVIWFTPLESEFTFYQYDLASLSDKGKYPFIDYWTEYPPVFPWISVGLYQMSKMQFLPNFSHRNHYALLACTIGVACDTGILYLIFQIAFLLYGSTVAEKIAWIYSSLFLSFFLSASFFDSIPAFLILISVYFLLWKNKKYFVSFLIALGIATKLIPLVLIPLCYKKNKKVLPIVVAIVFLFLFFMPFVFAKPCWLKTFWDVNLRRPAWGTVWALMSGEYSFPYIGPVPQAIKQGEDLHAILTETRIQSRFSTDISYLNEPSPRFKVFYMSCGILCFVLFCKGYKIVASSSDNSRLFAFGGFCLILFFVYSKGWSPQFLIYLLPIILVSFPEKIWISVVLTVINFIETPLWLFFFPENLFLFAFVILARTGLLIYCGWLFWNKMGETKENAIVDKIV